MTCSYSRRIPEAVSRDQAREEARRRVGAVERPRQDEERAGRDVQQLAGQLRLEHPALPEEGEDLDPDLSPAGHGTLRAEPGLLVVHATHVRSNEECK